MGFTDVEVYGIYWQSAGKSGSYREKGSKSLHRDPCLFDCILNSVSMQGQALKLNKKPTPGDKASTRNLYLIATLVHMDWEIYKLRQIKVQTRHRTLRAFSKDPGRSLDKRKDKLA